MTSIFPLKSFKPCHIIQIRSIQIVVKFEGSKQRVLGNERGHSTQPVRTGARKRMLEQIVLELTHDDCRRVGVMSGREGEEKAE